MPGKSKYFLITCEILEHIGKFPLNTLKFFYFVATFGTLSAAAEKLHVTHGAVSKQIKSLEAHLGLTLFVKNGRRLALAPAGRTLYECCHAMFHELDSTIHQLVAARGRDLVVSCEPTLAMRWLIPRIAGFKPANPFNVVILAAGGAVDFRRQAIDIAIRRNDFHWGAGVYAERLADERIGPVRKPGLAEQGKRLHTSTRPKAWEQWRQAGGHMADAQGEAWFEHFYLSIQAALAGMGVAIASELMVKDDIAQGILQAPDGFLQDGSSYYLLSETPLEADERKLQFLHWVQSQMQ